jgi:flagellar hook-basal body complex protein FliE
MIQGLSAVGSTSSTNVTNGLSGFSQSTTSATQAMEGGPSFASVLTNALGNSFQTMKQAEQLSIDALQGKADMRKVVDTVMSAEQSLQAAVAIRDKIVSAYLEVSRMAI